MRVCNGGWTVAMVVGLAAALLAPAPGCRRRQARGGDGEVRVVRYPPTDTLPGMRLELPWLLDQNPVPDSPAHVLMGGDLHTRNLVAQVGISAGRPGRDFPPCRGEATVERGPARDIHTCVEDDGKTVGVAYHGAARSGEDVYCLASWHATDRRQLRSAMLAAAGAVEAACVGLRIDR